MRKSEGKDVAGRKRAPSALVVLTRLKRFCFDGSENKNKESSEWWTGTGSSTLFAMLFVFLEQKKAV